MTTVPFSQLFGIGTPVKKRNVWSGTDRLVRSIVGGHKDVFQLRPKMSGVGGASFNMVTHNGVDMYVLTGLNAVYSSPDLVTLTSRAVPAGGAWNGASQVVSFQGDFFATYTISASAVIARSSDKGVTWVSYPSGSGSRMSVVGGLLYFLVNGNAANFSTTNAPGTAATARAFSRSAYWSKVVGTPTRQYCFGASASGDAATLDKADVATNGTSFSQDAACEALMAAAPIGMRHAHAIANGKTLLFNATSDGLYSLVADAAGVWSVGAAIPGELGDGYRLYGVGLPVSNTGNAQIVTDAEGVTYVLMVVQDGFGNYLPRVACTYDGVDWWWLPPHSNLGTTAPNFPLGMAQRIDGRVLAHFNSTRFVEANPNAVELYYEI